MKKIVALGAVALLVLSAAPALAATRSDRDTRGSTNDPAPVPTPIPQPPHNGSNGNNGNINNNSSSNANSGGNTGGTVITGDQTSTVHVENIGPTNNNTVVVVPGPQTPPQPAPEPESCGGRGCDRR
ncbi:hypothetical protein KW798_03140 [Candidatus Parcubacteria bacterium]|nr:hypothetical protein [Candidatus Parcubacteria bacterium]